MRYPALPVFASVLAFVGVATAEPTIHDDANPAGATVDGTLTAGEYGAFGVGINTGFGGLFGVGTRLHVKSAADGSLAFMVQKTSGMGCAFGADDSAVIYIDTVPGGFASTATFTDVGDGGRAAASGRGTGGGQSALTFAPGFTADYALVIRGDSASLFALTGGGAHTFVKAATQAPAVNFGNACLKEVGGFTMADLGSGPGRPFDYVGTLINASNGYRSNEFQGVVTATGTADMAGNIGANPFSLAAGDFSTFQTYAATPSLVRPKRIFAFSDYRGAGFQPSATVLPTQLSSDVFAATGWSDGDLAFGGTRITANTDYTRGAAMGPVGTGGFRSMVVAARPDGNGFGLQTGTADFAPGTLTVRLANSTGSALYGFDLDLLLFERNDQDRGTTFDTSYSTDGTNFTTLLTHTTPVAGVAMAAFTPVGGMSTTVSNTSIPVNGQLFIRFNSTDAGGSGSRDELALDALIVKPLVNLCPATFSDGLQCTQDLCDPVTGIVTHPPEPNTTMCDDADACTGMDRCDGMNGCAGTAVVCMPAAPTCFDAMTSRTQSNGVCNSMSGMCTFTTNDTNCPNGCLMATGLCSNDPCNLVTCDMPPNANCVDANTSATYAAMGTCDSANGMCSYTESQMSCPAGCDNTTGFCNGDPCATVTCDTPANDCFAATGTCDSTDGSCSYAPFANGTACDDADATTDNDVCDGNGVCAGTPTGTGGGSGDGNASDRGCGCAVAGEPTSSERSVALVLAGLGAVLLRRRKRATR